MSGYKSSVGSRAEKEWRALPVHLQRRFGEALVALQENPFQRRPGCDVRRLKGEPPAFALRVGAYRALFEVKGDLICVSSILHRRVAYRV